MDKPTYQTTKEQSLPGGKTPKNATIVYTKGYCHGNPGPGGYGVVIDDDKELSDGFKLTTNNRMAIMAVIKLLQNLKGSKKPVIIYSDSRYLIDAITKKWAIG